MNEKTSSEPGRVSGLWNTALVVASVSAVLGATLSGLGYLIILTINKDRADLRVSLESAQQAVPLVAAAPRFNGTPVYCEAVRLSLILSHNQEGKKPIRVTRLGLEAEPVPLTPTDRKKLAYDVDVLRLSPKGILEVREYSFVLDGQTIDARFLRSRTEGAVPVDATNILASTTRTEAMTVSPEGNDAHFQIGAAVETKAPGLYRVRFRAAYDVGGAQKEARTGWVTVYMK